MSNTQNTFEAKIPISAKVVAQGITQFFYFKSQFDIDGKGHQFSNHLRHLNGQ